jgi:hypothetical protein
VVNALNLDLFHGRLATFKIGLGTY